MPTLRVNYPSSSLRWLSSGVATVTQTTRMLSLVEQNWCRRQWLRRLQLQPWRRSLGACCIGSHLRKRVKRTETVHHFYFNYSSVTAETATPLAFETLELNSRFLFSIHFCLCFLLLLLLLFSWSCYCCFFPLPFVFIVLLPNMPIHLHFFFRDLLQQVPSPEVEICQTTRRLNGHIRTNLNSNVTPIALAGQRQIRGSKRRREGGNWKKKKTTTTTTTKKKKKKKKNEKKRRGGGKVWGWRRRGRRRRRTKKEEEKQEQKQK